MVAGRRLPLGASLGGSGDARCSVIERKRKRKRRRRSEEEKEEGGAKKKKKTHPPYTTLTPDRPSPDGPSMLISEHLITFFRRFWPKLKQKKEIDLCIPPPKVVQSSNYVNRASIFETDLPATLKNS